MSLLRFIAWHGEIGSEDDLLTVDAKVNENGMRVFYPQAAHAGSVGSGPVEAGTPAHHHPAGDDPRRSD